MTAKILVLLFLSGAMVLGQARANEGLVPVKRQGDTGAHLLPGADFRPYAKVLIEPATVAFLPNWLREANASVRDLRQRITQADADDIASDLRVAFDAAFPAALIRESGLTLAQTAGPGVLTVRPRVVDLVVAVPHTRRRQLYGSAPHAGHGTLEIELRDSVTGALLGRIHDWRQTPATTGSVNLIVASSNYATNLRQFRRLFDRWGELCASELQDFRARSPLPEALEANKKLPE